MFILALGRRKRVGKDVFAKHWREGFIDRVLEMMATSDKSFTMDISRVQNNVVIAGFADQLKIDAYNMFGWAGLQPAAFYELAENEHLRDVVLPAVGKTPRELWIQVGMFGRSINPDYWAKRLLELHRNLATDVLIVKDLRFANETQLCATYADQYMPIEIENPRIEMPTDVADTQDLGSWTVDKIVNDGTLEQWQITAYNWGHQHFTWAQVLADQYVAQLCREAA